jgi:hypothetical protein
MQHLRSPLNIFKPAFLPSKKIAHEPIIAQLLQKNMLGIHYIA